MKKIPKPDGVRVLKKSDPKKDQAFFDPGIIRKLFYKDNVQN